MIAVKTLDGWANVKEVICDQNKDTGKMSCDISFLSPKKDATTKSKQIIIDRFYFDNSSKGSVLSDKILGDIGFFVMAEYRRKNGYCSLIEHIYKDEGKALILQCKRDETIGEWLG